MEIIIVPDNTYSYTFAIPETYHHYQSRMAFKPPLPPSKLTVTIFYDHQKKMFPVAHLVDGDCRVIRESDYHRFIASTSPDIS